MLRGNYRPWNIKTRFARFNILAPLRHPGGMWGAVIVSRSRRQQANLAFPVAERSALTALAAQLARSFWILQHYQASYELESVDSLTGLFNQNYFTAALKRENARAKLSADQIPVLMVNIRSFKRINDTYGHLKGGELLAFVGELMKQVTRESDITARLSGDLFAAMLLNTDHQAGSIAKKRIAKLLELNPFPIGDENLALQARVSIVTLPEDDTKLGELINQAK